MLTLLAAGTSGCRADATFAIERLLPAPVALPGVRRLGVVAFGGPSGRALAQAIAVRLARDPAFEGVGSVESASVDDDAALAALCRERTADGLVVGRITTLEVTRTLETPTLVTKVTPAGTRELPSVRQLKTGQLQAAFRIVLADGRTRHGRAVSADLRFERTVDPRPDLTTLGPREMATQPDAIPSDEETLTRLIDLAAAAIVKELLPRREPALVIWEDAGGRDDEALRLFAEHAYGHAADALRSALAATPPPPAAERAALLTDLSLCEDAQGDYPAADRHLDEALTVESSERRLAALRDLRRREEIASREERR